MRGRRRGLRAAGAVAVLVVVLGYGAADALDVAPGPLTVALPPPPPPPFPTAPGADVPATAPDPGPTPVGTAAPLPDPVLLGERLRPLLMDPAFGGSVSATVVDALTGQVLVDAGAANPRVPASVTKLLTAAAALNRLGPEHAVQTHVVQGAAPDEIVLRGQGDVLLAAGAGNPAAARGHAGLADLADDTAAALGGAGRTSVEVRVDDTLFTGAALGPGWTPSDVAFGFVAPVTAVAVDAGRTAPENYAQRVADPALSAGATFAALLAERGVAVTGDVVRGPAPPDAQALASVTSAPLADVVAYMLASSDNTVAEALARLVALDAGLPASFEGASQAVLDEVALLGLPTAGAALADGSGLGDGSSLPPALVAGVLVLAASTDHPQLRPLLTGLPVAALSGTLAERFDESAGAAGWVRAKTGSLRGVTSLAGTVQDADGRLLVFAVLADAVPATTAARDAVDSVAAALVACGCR